MSTDTVPEPEPIEITSPEHFREIMRLASPTEPRPAQPTLREQFVGVLADTVDYPVPDAAWRLVLDAWRVIEVASARGDVPATCTREEWMAALRVAIFRLDHGVTEPAGFARG